MKKILTLISLSIAVASPVFAAKAKNTTHAQKAPALTAEEKKFLETYGYIVGKQSASQLGFTTQELKYVSRGYKKGALNQESPMPEDADGTAFQAYMQKKAEAHQKVREAQMKRDGMANEAKAKAKFAELAKNPKIKSTPSGLYYEVTKESKGPKPTATDTVTVNYEGRLLLDGSVFDSSQKHGQPATFNLEQVIPGFQEGLQHVGKGGSIRLYIPAKLGYEYNELPGIPAGSALVFEVDMLEIEKADSSSI